MRKRWFLVGMIFLLVPWLLVGCGVSEELYNEVVAERDSAQAELQTVTSELEATRLELQSVRDQLLEAQQIQAILLELAPSVIEEVSQKIAEDFVRNSPTFVFDGLEETLILGWTSRGECSYCWEFMFGFDCAHPGYGDRTGEILLQVITPHRVVIAVEQLEITSAVMDDKWDMISQEMVHEP